MISHEFIKEKSKTGFLQYTFQIKTSNLKTEQLTAVLNYLIDHIDVVYKKNAEMEEDTMWPITIKVGNEVTLAEATFWDHVFTSLKDGYYYLNTYIIKLLKLAEQTEFKMLLQSSEYQFHGGLAFNRFWIQSSEGLQLDIKQLALLINSYSLWLSKNDLGYETNQDDCINLIFNNYKLLNDAAIATLLAQRITDGQITDKGFDYYVNVLVRRSKGSVSLLKKVIDQLLNNDVHLNGSRYKLSMIYEICAVIYGSNKKCTAIVVDYAKNQSSEELRNPHDFEMKKINYLRQVADIYWQQVTSQDRYIDTSFHLFDTHTKKWIDYSEREDD